MFKFDFFSGHIISEEFHNETIHVHLSEKGAKKYSSSVAKKLRQSCYVDVMEVLWAHGYYIETNGENQMSWESIQKALGNCKL